MEAGLFLFPGLMTDELSSGRHLAMANLCTTNHVAIKANIPAIKKATCITSGF